MRIFKVLQISFLSTVSIQITIWTPDRLTWLAVLQITLILIKVHKTRLCASNPYTDGNMAHFALSASVEVHRDPFEPYVGLLVIISVIIKESHPVSFHQKEKGQCAVCFLFSFFLLYVPFFSRWSIGVSISSWWKVTGKKAVWRKCPWWHVWSGTLMKLFL